MTTDDDDVYVDSGYRLGHFADEVWCSCPKCGQLAIVRERDSPSVDRAARITCRSCAYAHDWPADGWLGPALGIAHGTCASCGWPLGTELERRRFRRNLPTSVRVTCDACGRRSAARVRWQKPHYGQTGVDPYFALPLFLQADCGRQTVWAYNPRHLDELLRFARSDSPTRSSQHRAHDDREIAAVDEVFHESRPARALSGSPGEEGSSGRRSLVTTDRTESRSGTMK